MVLKKETVLKKKAGKINVLVVLASLFYNCRHVIPQIALSYITALPYFSTLDTVVLV